MYATRQSKLYVSPPFSKVDIFYVSGHKEDVCMPPDNPNCKYHPHVAKFEEIRAVPIQSLELTRRMTQFKTNVLFSCVNEWFNSDLEAELK